MPNSIRVRLFQRTTNCQPAECVDLGAGRVLIVSDDESRFSLYVADDRDSLLLMSVDRTTSIRRDGERSITFSNSSAVEYELVFAEPAANVVVWIALCMLISGDVSTMVPEPSLHNIRFLRHYLASLRVALFSMIAHSASCPGFIQALFATFAKAEMEQRFDVLQHFRPVVLSLMQLNSRAVLAQLLSAQNIDNTIACMEYDSTMGEITSYQTTHRCFLSQTKLHQVLPSLHDQFKTLARTNYRIMYLKSAILNPLLSTAVIETIDSILSDNCCEIVHTLLSDRSFAKNLAGAVVPVVISVNDQHILSAAPDENVLHFLVELFKLPIPESVMRRLVRKLCENRLLDFLEHAFVTGTSASGQSAVLDVFSALHQVAPSRVYEFLFAPERNFTSMIIKRLSGSSEVTVVCDRSLEFLQTMITSFDPMQFNTQHDGSIDHFVGAVLPGLTSGLLRAEKDCNSSIKQRKVSEFVGWLIQTRPDLCRSRFGSCVTWFVSLADRVLIDLDLSAQQKQLRMSSARLLSQAASVSDDSFVRAMLNRTGMLDSVLLMLLSNSGSGNMFGSVMQGMICTMAEHWLKSLLAGRASKLLDSMSTESFSGALHQLTFAFSSAVANVCTWFAQSKGAVPSKPVLPPLQRTNSLELYDENSIEGKEVSSRMALNATAIVSPAVPVHVPTEAELSRLTHRCQQLDRENHELKTSQSKLQSDVDSLEQKNRQLCRQLAVQRLVSLTSNVVRRQQNAAFGRLKKVVAVPATTPSPAPKVPDPFLMEALYALAWQRKLDRQRSMAFALRSSLLPMLKRVHLSDALRHWRAVVRQAKIQVVLSPTTNSTGSVKSLPPIVPYRDPTSNIDFNQPGAVMYSPIVWTTGLPATDMSSPDSRSSSGSHIESPNTQSPRHSFRSTPSSTISPGVPQSFCFQSPKPMMSRQSTAEFGEEIGSRVDKRRSDSDTFYTIHTLKHSGSQLFGTGSRVNAERGKALKFTPRPTPPPMPSNYSNPAQALSRFPVS